MAFLLGWCGGVGLVVFMLVGVWDWCFLGMFSVRLGFPNRISRCVCYFLVSLFVITMCRFL